MTSKQDNSIKNNVIGGLIVAGILYFIRPMREISLIVIKYMYGLMKKLFFYLTINVSIQRWIVWLLIAVFIYVITRTIRVFFSTANQIFPEHYKEDSFFGLVWRWKYDYGMEPTDMAAFCPNCDMQIIKPRTVGITGDKYQYWCSKCDFKSQAFENSHYSLTEWIKLEVQRLLRTEEYRERIKKAHNL